jgi:hypothetical protein
MWQPLEQTGMDTYLADAPVGCKDDDWRQARLQCPVQVGEALNVQHVHLIYEKHTWYELCHTLVYVLVDHLRGIRDSSTCAVCLLTILLLQRTSTAMPWSLCLSTICRQSLIHLPELAGNIVSPWLHDLPHTFNDQNVHQHFLSLLLS